MNNMNRKVMSVGCGCCESWRYCGTLISASSSPSRSYKQMNRRYRYKKICKSPPEIESLETFIRDQPSIISKKSRFYIPLVFEDMKILNYEKKLLLFVWETIIC